MVIELCMNSIVNIKEMDNLSVVTSGLKCVFFSDYVDEFVSTVPRTSGDILFSLWGRKNQLELVLGAFW